MESWHPEIEKKYRLSGEPEVRAIREAARASLLLPVSYALQRDWVPDFDDSRMACAGVLLRIRNESYREGSGPAWTVTLKQKQKVRSLHVNRELEASSGDDSRVSALKAELFRLFGEPIDIERVAGLDYDYAARVGLTKHRMLLEKYRASFRDAPGTISLAIDELPQPLGFFAEIEGRDAGVFPEWEARLGLSSAPVVAEDYGELVKMLDGGRRTLTF